MWRSHGRASLAGQILWAGKAEKGEVASPLMTTYGEIQNGASELRFFKGGAECLVLVLHPTKVLATGGAYVG